jgi:hypothetical protein
LNARNVVKNFIISNPLPIKVKTQFAQKMWKKVWAFVNGLELLKQILKAQFQQNFLNAYFDRQQFLQFSIENSMFLFFYYNSTLWG